MKLRFLLFFTLIFGLAACNRELNVNVNGDGTATISVAVTEAEVNTVAQNALSANRNPLLRNPVVDLQNGQIVISGEHERRDGSGRVAGTITLSVTVVSGELQVQVTAVNIEGLDVNDERIQQFNSTLAERLGGRARQNNSNATLQSVTITNDNITLEILVSR